MAILYVASEDFELKPFAARLGQIRTLKWPLRYAVEGILDGRRVLLAAHGAGPKLAAAVVETAIRAVAAADLSASRLEAIVSTGLCGGLRPELRENEIVSGLDIVTETGLSYPASLRVGEPQHSGTILSVDRVAGNSAEKLRFAETGAIAVEMEAAGVAERARRNRTPVACVKVVSDRLDEEFAFDVNAMRTPDGRIARGKIMKHALVRPTLLPHLLHLQRRAKSAAEALGDFLVRCPIDIGPSSREEEMVVTP